MNEKLTAYVDDLFSQYEDDAAVRDLKEELNNNLQERWNDLKAQGYDDEAATRMTIDSIGDISEAVQSVSGKTKALPQMVARDLSSTTWRMQTCGGSVSLRPNSITAH